MNCARYLAAPVAAASILSTAPDTLAIEKGEVEIVFHSQSVYYPMEEEDFAFEISGTLPGKAGEGKRLGEKAMKSDGSSMGIGGILFYAATWRCTVPDGLKGAVLTMTKGPENAVFQIRDQKTGKMIGGAGTSAEFGDIEGEQLAWSLSVFCAARAQIKVVDEEDTVIDDAHLSGMTVTRNSPMRGHAENVPFTSVEKGSGRFACAPTAARVSVVVSKAGYESYRLVVDCGSPQAEHARRVTLKKKKPADEEREDEDNTRRGRGFDETEDGKLAWGKGYPVQLAVRYDPPKEKYRVGDILSRSFLIHNVSDREITFESAASLSHAMSVFKKVAPGKEAERGEAEVFDADEGVYQQVQSTPRDKNVVQHRLAPGEIAEVPFSPMRLGEGPMPGPPGHVVHSNPGGYLFMSYQLQPVFLSENPIPNDADWRGTVRTGNMYLRLAE